MSSAAVGPLILVVCMGFLVMSTRRGFKRRGGAARVRRGPLFGEGESTRAAGTAGAISDAGNVPRRDLLAAMSVPGAPRVNADDEEDDVSILGLELLEGSHVNQLARVMHGRRDGRQVFVRQGLVGNAVSPGLGLRRSRSIAVVRVAAPLFEAQYGDGRIEPGLAAPASVRGLFAGLADSPDVWHDARLVSGPDGIAVSRADADDWIGGWLYDLWLLERLAVLLHAEPLATVALPRTWHAPYGLHRWSPSLVDAVRAVD